MTPERAVKTPQRGSPIHVLHRQHSHKVTIHDVKTQRLGVYICQLIRDKCRKSLCLYCKCELTLTWTKSIRSEATKTSEIVVRRRFLLFILTTDTAKYPLGLKVLCWESHFWESWIMQRRSMKDRNWLPQPSITSVFWSMPPGAQNEYWPPWCSEDHTELKSQPGLV